MSDVALLTDAGSGGSEPPPSSALAFVADAETRAVVQAAFSRLELESARVENGNIRTAIERLGVQRSPRLLVVDLEGIELPFSEVDELAEVCEPGVSVIALGRRDEVALFRGLLERGITDYFVKPVPPELLSDSLKRAVEGWQAARRITRLGKSVVVLGVRGGVGATTVACGLAHIISARHRRRVALLDLDLQFGTVALTLDLDPVNGLRDALEQVQGIDPLLVERLGNAVSETFSAFAAEVPLSEHPLPDVAATEGVVELLRQRFHYLLIDLPRQPAEMLLAGLERADVVVLVADLSLAAMRDTLRLSQLVSRVNPSARLVVVANKAGWAKSGEIERSEFERGIGRAVDYLLPFDPVRVAGAVNTGQLSYAERGPMASTLAALAGEVAGKPVAQGRGLLDWLRRRR